MSRTPLLAGATALALAVGTGAAIQQDWLAPAAATPPASQAGVVLPTATAELGSLVSRKELPGTLTYGQSWALPISGTGVVTHAPAVGATVGPGQELIRIDDRPVLLAEGSMPMYRTLELSAATKDQLRGDDVAQLQRFLALSGVPETSALPADGVFGARTRAAVRAWQKSLRLPRTGGVDASTLLFVPSAVRVAKVDRVGAAFSAIEVTDGDPVIQLSLTGRDRSLLAEGDAVTVIADSEEVDGVVASVTSTTNTDGQPVSTVTVQPQEELADGLDRVTVVATRELAAEAVIVPASALIALSDGGYAVELSDPSRTLTRVQIGAVHDGRVEITSGLAAGQDVVVAP